MEHPFRSAVHIPFPSSEAYDRDAILLQLKYVTFTREHNAVEYIHQSGVAFLRLLNDEVVWYASHLLNFSALLILCVLRWTSDSVSI